MEEVSNLELEDWVNEFCDLDRFMVEEDRRMKEQGLVYGIIFDNESYYHLDYSRASFVIKKNDIQDYVYVDKLSHCKQGYEDEYINKTYKFICMEGEQCAIFFRDY